MACFAGWYTSDSTACVGAEWVDDLADRTDTLWTPSEKIIIACEAIVSAGEVGDVAGEPCWQSPEPLAQEHGHPASERERSVRQSQRRTERVRCRSPPRSVLGGGRENNGVLDKELNMTCSHHRGGEQLDAMRRFMEQIDGTARRQYPAGRMGAEDDGELAYALATDDRHNTIVIRFGKPVEWIGLGIKEATELRDQLTERLQALRGITV